MSTELATVIEKMAAKLEVPVTHLWGVMVKQAAIYPYVAMLEIAFLIAGLIVFRYSINKYIEYDNKKRYPEGASGFLNPVYFIAAIALAVVIAATMSTVITAIFNPEYWALMQIMGKR